MTQTSLAPPTRRTPPSDYVAMNRFLQKLPGPVAVSQRYAAGRLALEMEAEGYRFPWGAVVESLSGLLVVLDFHLEGLRAEYERREPGLALLQERAFAALEDMADPRHVSRGDPQLWNDLTLGRRGWVLAPATPGQAAAFSALCHINQEEECRQWLVAEIITCLLPELIERLYGALEENA